MSIDVSQEFLEHAQVAHAALDLANAELTKQAATQKRAHDLIPQVVQELLKHNRILPQQEKEAMEALKDPERAMQILLKAANPNQTTQAQSLGGPENGQQKQANYPGQRTSTPRESDLAYERALGFA